MSHICLPICEHESHFITKKVKIRKKDVTKKQLVKMLNLAHRDIEEWIFIAKSFKETRSIDHISNNAIPDSEQLVKEIQETIRNTEVEK